MQQSCCFDTTSKDIKGWCLCNKHDVFVLCNFRGSAKHTENMPLRFLHAIVFHFEAQRSSDLPFFLLVTPRNDRHFDDYCDIHVKDVCPKSYEI